MKSYVIRKTDVTLKNENLYPHTILFYRSEILVGVCKVIPAHYRVD